ncbi:hypothetical protein D9757_001730 [Collybiopsis confluens]|uniref:C2 domain-containing protein n=1 Tax=Collybiopsis confluens TaxID=2823264 RepID=A0A8H5MF84_9AGAR|nr:hypothetical protein D9757_001730 [Collybiopsis confluens]
MRLTKAQPQSPQVALRASSLPLGLDCPQQLSRRNRSTSIRSGKSSASSSHSLSHPEHKGRRLGTLVAVVLRARHLPDRHVCSKQNVYAQIIFCGETRRTNVAMRGGQTPTWDEELRFGIWAETAEAIHLPPTPTDTGIWVADAKLMKISIWEDNKGHDILVGEGLLDVTRAYSTGEFDEWIPLWTRDGTQRGEVFLELTYFSAGRFHVPSPPPPFGVAGALSYARQSTCPPALNHGPREPAHQLSRTPHPSSRTARHKHTRSLCGPAHSMLAKQRPRSIQMDKLSVTISTNLVLNTHDPTCESPLDSPTPTLAEPLFSFNDHSVRAPSPSPERCDANLSPEPSWADKMTSLIHNVAGILHIHGDYKTELELESDTEASSVDESSLLM